MATDSPDRFIRALGEVALARLKQRDVVELPGLGRLEVRHEPSSARVEEDGRRTLIPPRDRIVFVAESQHS